MKFLHTADWQIGMKAEGTGEAAGRVRAARLEAGRRLVAMARQEGAEFIAVAGDLFEDNAVDRALVQQVADILAGFGGPVYIIPGNHDPLVPGSVWEHPAWRRSDTLHLLEQNDPVRHGACWLYPCPLREKHGGKDPTVWIPSREDDSIRIGIAHGTVEGIQDGALEFPIPRDAAERAGLDYVALGHWHSTATYPASDGAVRMAYSGTHEPSKFGERDSGNTLLVDISGPGSAPRIMQMHTGVLAWVVIEEDARAPGDVARLRERVEAIENPGHTLVRVTLTGLLHAEDQEELAHMEDILASRFLHGRLDAADLRPSPEDEGWITALPPGIVRETAQRLRQIAAADQARDAEGEIAARALMELYAVASEDGGAV